MKAHSSAPILLLLIGLAIFPAAFAQSLPASMAYSSSVLVRSAPAETAQKLLIAGNSLTQDHRSAFDLSEIPAAPDSIIRDAKIPSTAVAADDFANNASSATPSKMSRAAVLLGVLAIAYLATRKRSNPRMHADISELRNFPKKRLAHHEAHA